MAALDLPAAAADAFTGEVDVSEATIRPVIADSWRRCSRAGLDPLVWPPVPRPDPRAAATVTALDAELLDVSAPIMAEARELLARSNTIMILANRSGIVLGTEGDRATMDAAAEIRLTPGADWSEDARGTNGIGTALRTGGP